MTMPQARRYTDTTAAHHAPRGRRWAAFSFLEVLDMPKHGKKCPGRGCKGCK